MHTLFDRFYKNFFEKNYPPHLFEMGRQNWGCFLKKFLENKKSPLDSLNREENGLENY